MNSNRIIFTCALAVVFALSYFGWKLTARGAYEAAQYELLVSDGCFEVRDYPTLTMATTPVRFDSRGDDASFMRLFRYIQGANRQERQVAMTVPVFTESGRAAAETDRDATGWMGFVMPREVARQGVPQPSNGLIQIRHRSGGRFAVVRFSGRAGSGQVRDAERRLRRWMLQHGLVGDAQAEIAGYDPPWTPGVFRRNEVLVRLRSTVTR